MLKRVVCLILSLGIAFSSIPCVYAEDDVKNEQNSNENETGDNNADSTDDKTDNKTDDNENKDDSSNSDKKDKVEEISESRSIEMKEAEKLDITEYLHSRVIAADYTYSSSDKTVCTISGEGVITARKEGNSIVKAEYKNDKYNLKYEFKVEVKEAKVTSTKKVTVKVDKSQNLYEYVNDSVKASDYDWDTEDTKYVSVSSRGVVTGKKAGNAEVTARYSDGNKYYNYLFKVTVSKSNSKDDDDDDDDDKADIKTSWTIYVPEGKTISVKELLEDDPDDYDWSVSDKDIVRVDEDTAKFRGVEKGSTKVHAKGDDNYTFTVKVSKDYSVDTASVKKGNSIELEDMLNNDVDEYKFKSDNTAVATVSSTGKVTGKANGPATIICEHEDGDVVQIFVTVKSTGATTTKKNTTTTRETTTETTTQKIQKTETKKAVDTSKTDFKDISHRQWAVGAIKAMAEKGFILGRNASAFAPDDTCTRADFTVVLMRILGYDSLVATSNYADIPFEAYYYNSIGIAKEKGIESGVANNSFRPLEAITREDIMAMVYKGLQSYGVQMDTNTACLDKYTDKDLIRDENKPYIAALINLGAVSGTTDTTIDSSANITRAQMAVLLNNVYSKIK